MPLPIPSWLQRIGPFRSKAYILYDEMGDTEVLGWGIGTCSGNNRSIKWDSAHLSQARGGFPQVVHSSDGAPKIICKRCGQILQHPQSVRNGKGVRQGTATTGKHLQLPRCIDSSKDRSQKSDIRQISVLALFYKVNTTPDVLSVTFLWPSTWNKDDVISVTLTIVQKAPRPKLVTRQAGERCDPVQATDRDHYSSPSSVFPKLAHRENWRATGVPTPALVPPSRQGLEWPQLVYFEFSHVELLSD